MENNIRPETMKRITTPELANEFIEEQVALIREQVGNKKVLLALSGGVDSSVVAAILIKAIGKQLVCVHVNHGLMRKGESEQVIEIFEKGLNAKYRVENSWQQRPYNGPKVFASAGAGLWTTANDQLKFYKMLMNLGVGDNGVRILKEETVKSILAVSTRPEGLGGYSLGLSAPETDNDNAWFGHGGAWGTNCQVNYHRKELKLWAVQLCGSPRPWDKVRHAAAERFFRAATGKAAADAYTGRTK